MRAGFERPTVASLAALARRRARPARPTRRRSIPRRATDRAGAAVADAAAHLVPRAAPARPHRVQHAVGAPPARPARRRRARARVRRAGPAPGRCCAPRSAPSATPRRRSSPTTSTRRSRSRICRTLPADQREAAARPPPRGRDRAVVRSDPRRRCSASGCSGSRADDHVLFFMPHHIIWDGWSFDLFYEEMSALYAAELAGTPADPRRCRR